MTEQTANTANAAQPDPVQGEAELSPGAIRARRSRAHANGDHSLCLPKNCRYASEPEPEQETDMTEATPAVTQPEARDKLVAGIPSLAVYPNGDPSYAERQNPAPEPNPHALLTILNSVAGSSGLASAESLKVRAVVKAMGTFDASVPAEVVQAAQVYELARQRQAEMRNARPRRFEAADLLADDWQDRLDRTLSQATQQGRSAWEPVVGAAVEEAARNLRAAVARALPGVVAQVEQWLRDNQRNLAIYSNGGGDVTPNQSATWKGWAGEVWDFARLTADAGGGGGQRVHQLPRAVQEWALLWDWTAEQWHELSDHTKPGRELRDGDTLWGVALKIGAKVSIPLSTRELKDRYDRLWASTPVGQMETAIRNARSQVGA